MNKLFALYEDIYSNKKYIYNTSEVESVYMSNKRHIAFNMEENCIKEILSSKKGITFEIILDYLNSHGIDYEVLKKYNYERKADGVFADCYVATEEELNRLQAKFKYVFKEQSTSIDELSNIDIGNCVAYFYKSNKNDMGLFLVYKKAVNLKTKENRTEGEWLSFESDGVYYVVLKTMFEDSLQLVTLSGDEHSLQKAQKSFERIYAMSDLDLF